MKVTMNTINTGAYQNTNYAKRPAFNGFYDNMTTKMAQGFANVAKKQKTVDFIDSMAKKDVIKTLAASTGILISGLYIYNTAKSKKIEKEQKKPLMINMALVTALSTVAAWCINDVANKKIEDFTKFFKAKNAKMDAKALDTCVKGIRPASTLLIFTTVYRYLSPVIATPLANKISNALSPKNPEKKV